MKNAFIAVTSLSIFFVLLCIHLYGVADKLSVKNLHLSHKINDLDYMVSLENALALFERREKNILERVSKSKIEFLNEKIDIADNFTEHVFNQNGYYEQFNRSRTNIHSFDYHEINYIEIVSGERSTKYAAIKSPWLPEIDDRSFGTLYLINLSLIVSVARRLEKEIVEKGGEVDKVIVNHCLAITFKDEDRNTHRNTAAFRINEREYMLGTQYVPNEKFDGLDQYQSCRNEYFTAIQRGDYLMKWRDTTEGSEVVRLYLERYGN